MEKSLDEIIDAERKARPSGGAVRRPAAQRSNNAPYHRRNDGVEKRGRGNFRYGGDATGSDGVAKRGKPQSGSTSGGTSVYIGNLAWTVTWRTLKDHLSSAGECTFVDVATKPDGKSRGFAIAQFSSARAARTAISTLHESELEGRNIVVREDTSADGSGGGRRGRGGNLETRRLRDPEEDDGYSFSGSNGRNGWVKPSLESFVDDGPPPEPRGSMLR